MNNLLATILNFMQTRLGGLLLFVLVAAGTFIDISHVWSPPPAAATPIDIRSSILSSDGRMKMKAVLSQDKLLVGRSGLVSLELSINTPLDKARRSSSGDFMVVLDRSGSMQAERRMSFAKTAIKNMLEVLHEGDRFGLVTFDHQATEVVPLTQLTSDKRQHIAQLVDLIEPRGSTNLSEGITLAHQLLKSHKRQAVTTIVVLSDGEANLGIQHPDGLNSLAKGIADSEMVLSTIGMGLGFNERVMTSLADFGMGTFDYLETLESLGGILGRAVNSSREVYAQSSYLEFPKMSHASVVQAGGFPLERSESGAVIIPLGQLMHGVARTIMIQLQLDTSRVRGLEIPGAILHYVSNGQRYHFGGEQKPLVVAVLDATQSAEARASINMPVVEKNYHYDKFGSMQRKFSQAISAGDREAAASAMKEYENDLDEARDTFGAPLVSEGNERLLSAMKSELGQAFSGPQARQKEQQNRLGKKYWKESLLHQRQQK